MSFAQELRRLYPGDMERDAHQFPALTLAFLGDTLYDLYVRTYLVQRPDARPRTLHVENAARICAHGQADAFSRIEHMLTEDEAAVYRRGRNARRGTAPKTANSGQYHTASGFEALLGYLFLSGQEARMTDLMRRALGIDEGGMEHGV